MTDSGSIDVFCTSRLCLDPSAKDSIARAVLSLRPCGPLPVVVASDAYAHLLENWVAHAHELGITDFLIVAMDDKLQARLSDRGLVVARGHFDGSAADFWLRRLLIWQYLLQLGVHIVQSDVDALWIRNPIPTLFADQQFDILCSQGTLHPSDTAALWGFVLCTGLMSMRPSASTVRFIDAFARKADLVLQTDDQEVMNHMLVEGGAAWNRHGLASCVSEVRGNTFETFDGIIDCRDAVSGATIGLLPHALFPRLPTAAPGAYVKHVLRPEDDSLRIEELRAVGCWKLGNVG